MSLLGLEMNERRVELDQWSRINRERIKCGGSDAPRLSHRTRKLRLVQVKWTENVVASHLMEATCEKFAEKNFWY
jgi:hypothetical protein